MRYTTDAAVTCENPLCESPGFQEVDVSVRKAGDEKRTLCAACEEAYTWGVQHGTLTAEQAPLFIVIVTDRGWVAFARAFPAQISAELELVRYLWEHQNYRGPKSLEAALEWAGEQTYLTAEIVEQDALVETGK